MDSEDGQIFVKARRFFRSGGFSKRSTTWLTYAQNLAHFVRTHEKALANALQLRKQRPKNPQNAGEASPTEISGYPPRSSSTSSAFAAALSMGALSFSTHNIKPAKLTLTPHHLFYLLSRFEEIGIQIGPMNVRLESLHAEASPANYVSFLSQSQRSNRRTDRDSIHSVSSVRSVMSGMSSLWANFGLGHSSSAAKSEKAKAQLLADTKYLYSAFTKIPCLRLSPDRKARLIRGYEEFPFDTAVPLLAFKNLSALEICDVDFRQFFGWDKLADQLRSLTVKRASIDDPTDLLVGVVLDDMDKRRRRSSKTQSSPMLTWPSSPFLRYSDLTKTSSGPNSPIVDDKLSHSTSPRKGVLQKADSDDSDVQRQGRGPSTSPSRPSSSRQDTTHRHMRGGNSRMKRSGSSSSNSSDHSSMPFRSGSSSNLLSMGILPASKWRFLRHLSLADNSLTSMSTSSLAPLANTLHSLDLSSNLFAEIPDCLASLTALRALNLSNCMIESLHSLRRNPLPAITSLNLRSNRLASIAGVERLLSLERLDLRDNRVQDPTELARLTGIPDVREIWVVSNPFTRTHGNYRVTIFNLFRGTPGYSQDVVIDALGPGYSERKQLRDRVGESESVPIIKPQENGSGHSDASLLQGPVLVSADDFADLAKNSQRPMPLTTQSEIAIGSNRRKRVPKRRIVDLAKDESTVVPPGDMLRLQPETLPSIDLSSTGTGTAEVFPRDIQAVRPTELRSTETRSQIFLEQAEDRISPPNISDKGQVLANEIQHQHLNGETYRQKVEALKAEVGSNWLSVLTEEGWNKHGNLDARIPHYVPPRPDISGLRVQSQGIISGSRTLG